MGRSERAYEQKVAMLETQVGKLKLALEQSRATRTLQLDTIEKQEAQLREQAETLTKLTADLEKERSRIVYYQKLWQEACTANDKMRAQHRDEIEKRRVAIESLLRLAADVHEAVVHARFDGTEAGLVAGLAKVRSLVQAAVTTETVRLAAPPDTALPVWLMALGGIGIMAAIYKGIFGAYAAPTGAAPAAPAATPPPPSAASAEGEP